MARPLPPVIRIEPASACNLRCGHCPTGTVEMARGLMSEKVFARVLSETAKHVPPIRVAVLYHGGEPLLNKSFPEMARAVKSLGIPKVKTVTNGMFLRAEIIPPIVRSGLLNDHP
jgi:MoaA/NifB/PqqE/SkfB family radical SAM enzyme